MPIDFPGAQRYPAHARTITAQRTPVHSNAEGEDPHTQTSHPRS